MNFQFFSISQFSKANFQLSSGYPAGVHPLAVIVWVIFSFISRGIGAGKVNFELIKMEHFNLQFHAQTQLLRVAVGCKKSNLIIHI